MIKLLIGGSPCTFWSIAQKSGRETEASGMGWELFKNYLIAKEKFKPDFFLYENNKSAAQPIKDQISKELGVDLMYINSALVSAQNRQRFYAFNWEVDQPEDRGILLRDILETTTTEIGYSLSEREMDYMVRTTRDGRNHFDYGYIYDGTRDKSQCITANVHKGVPYNVICEPVRVGALPRPNGELSNSQAKRVYSIDGKSVNLIANGGGEGAKTGLYAIPYELSDEYFKGGFDSGLIGMTTNGEGKYRNGSQPSQQYRVYSCDGKSQVVNTLGNENYVVPSDGKQQPVNVTDDGKSQTIKAQYSFTSIPNICCYNSTYGATGVAVPTDQEPSEQFTGSGKDWNAMKRVYEVKNGLITIKDKQYPIKLADGNYIIRKLTPVECERLQTLPDGYTKAVSNTQRYKGLGNGWTAEVIIHILNGALKDVPRDEEIVVLSMYDGIGTGRYCLDKMGFTNVKYFAYEIDKYAKQVALDNYPDIIHMGDAFNLRNPDWTIGY